MIYEEIGKFKDNLSVAGVPLLFTCPPIDHHTGVPGMSRFNGFSCMKDTQDASVFMMSRDSGKWIDLCQYHN